MGMYTELVLGILIKPDDTAIAVLKYMLDEESNCPEIDHELFKTDRWEFMLRSGSYYFDGYPDSKLVYDSIGKDYHLNVRCNLKNYDNEIQKFLDWLCPYIKTEGFLGYMRYEEYEDPDLIYRQDGMIKIKLTQEGEML